MARTPQEIFQHHGEVLMAEDIDGIVSDYADDAIFITPDGVLRGKDGVRRGVRETALRPAWGEVGAADHAL